MFYILGSDGQQYGPADAKTIQSWITAGRASLQTQARRDGEMEWRALGEFPEFGAVAAQPPALPAAKVEIAKIDAEAFAADLISRAAPLDIMSCVSRAWNLYKADFWPIFGCTILGFLVLGAVPFGALIASGIIMGGMYYYYLGKIRGQHRQLGDIFIGMSRMTMPLFMGGLIICGISFVSFLIIYLVMIAGALAQSVPVMIVAGALMVVWLFVLTYLGMIWTFTFALIIDKNLDHKDAMKVSSRVVRSQFWRMLGLMVVSTVLNMVGFLCLIVGAYFVIPVIMGAYAYAYEDLCNPKK